MPKEEADIPQSALSRVCVSNRLLLGSQPAFSCFSLCEHKSHFFLDFMPPKMMDLLLSDLAVSLFDLGESRSSLIVPKP